MFRIAGIVLSVFACSGVIAIASGQTPVDVVSVLMLVVFAAGAVFCFKKAGKKAKKEKKSDSAAYSYISFRVAGTSFATDGVSRQDELRKMKDGLPPYGQEADVSLKVYTYEGEPAVGCYVNGFQIGNVPRDLVQQVIEALKHRDVAVSEFSVTGGDMRGREKLNYGARIVIRHGIKK